MKSDIFLSLGESFLELGANKENEFVCERFYLPKIQLHQAIKQFCKNHQIQPKSYRIVLRSFNELVSRRLGTPVVFITTQGFENWLSMNMKNQRHGAENLLNKELVFGIGERINSRGEIIKGLDDKEIEFLVQKLKMNKVTRVAVGLLHSDKNATHEKQLETELAKNFEVVCSYNFSHYFSQSVPSERQRWMSVVLTSYAKPILTEMIEETLEQLNEAELTAEFYILNHQREWVKPEQAQLLNCMAADNYLLRDFIETEQKYSSLLYFGFDQFKYLNQSGKDHPLEGKEYGLVSATIGPCEFLPIQPRQKIVTSFWGLPDFSNQLIPAAPGPMSFSPSLQPCLIDIFNLKQHLSDYSNFTNDKSARKIEENIISLSRTAMFEDSISFGEVIDHLQNIFAYKLVNFLEKKNENFYLSTGPLAKAVTNICSPLLKSKQIKLLESDGLILQLAQRSLQ